MALPKKLKNFNLFQNGENFAGQVAEVTPPKLTRKMEAYRGGGMNGPIDIDQGQEGIVLEWTAGGFMRSVCAQYGITKHDGVQLRFAGARAYAVRRQFCCENVSRPREGNDGASVGGAAHRPHGRAAGGRHARAISLLGPGCVHHRRGLFHRRRISYDSRLKTVRE